ncbi:pilus assembly protein PilA [Veronia nyctiphanis]|uniref:Pilus assembly protein PilA n=1 Tax=Veronia nyctiphanis TaxID=1278244 RepID=A0A4Q0YTJ2_9GAMM|nr:prepilin-type N-terminal cleavage/methylation domain-containing protein [Veronia nyctiphanis]RXJ72469.1 pilus assembly protein PilA [Veronia nyctiphanis]
MRKQQGFSLIELLIVVAIIGTLAAIAVPAYTAQKDKSDVAAAMASLKSLLAGATLAVHEGQTVASYVTGLDGTASTTLVINGIGTIQDATAGNVPGIKIVISDGTFSGKDIKYSQAGTIWKCDYDKTITGVTIDGCSARP